MKPAKKKRVRGKHLFSRAADPSSKERGAMEKSGDSLVMMMMMMVVMRRRRMRVMKFYISNSIAAYCF